jgi:hypothetical protein
MAKHNARIGGMFNQHRRTLMRAGTLLLALLLLAASGWAQDFVNSGTLTNHGTLKIKANLVNTLNGVINNTSTGRIRFVSNTGQFRNEQPDITKITNNGWFIFEGTDNSPTHKLFTDGTGTNDNFPALGSRCNFRVPGNMRYTASSGTQNVQARYYTNLEMDGASAKAIPDAVYVSGTYTAAGGNRTYSGTFYYDGTDNQTIFAETATSGSVNRYNNLAIMTGSGDCAAAGTSTKTIADNKTISLIGDFFSADNRTTLLLQGQLFAVNVTANGPITINDPTPDETFAELRTTGTATTYAANVTVTAGLFKVADGRATVQSTLSLANSTYAQLQLDAGAMLDIEGELENNLLARTNWTFDATSTIRFTKIADGQTIPYTVASNPYGNVYTSGGTKSTESGGDVVMAGNLTVESGNITVASTRVWNMTNPSATVTYSGAGENSEIIGKMQRTISGTGLYIFNNDKTRVTFTAGTLPTTMTLAVFPQTDPNNYDNTKDVQRKVTVSWDGSNNWTATFRVGYKTSDIPSTWDASVSQSNLRFYESPTSGTPEKVSTGYPYTRSAASGANLGYIELAGIQGTAAAVPNGFGYITSGNDLLLRGGPSVFYAIRSGRWSNPNTWDEGAEPSPWDEVVIDGYTVHAGYKRAIDDWDDDEAYPTQLAAKITIGSSLNSALLFGSDGGSKTFSLNMAAAGELINNRFGTETITDGTPNTGSSPIDAGLVVYTTSGREITLKAKSLQNNGTLFNFGEIEVGP